MLRACFSLVWLLQALHQTWAVELPGCQFTPPPQTLLKNVRTAFLDVPQRPFGIVYAKHGHVAFAALSTTVAVLNTSTFVPTLLHEIAFPSAALGEALAGIALSPNGRHVFVAASAGAIVIDAEKAIDGSQDAVIGFLNGTAGISAIQVTAEGDYAFVSQEYGNRATGHRGTIEVFKLNLPVTNGTLSSTYVGFLTLGDSVVATTLSPDGSILYATSEGTGAADETKVGNFSSFGPSNATSKIEQDALLGSLSIIDVKTLKTNPSKALIANTTAGCNPVRVIVSSDGKIVWLTARDSNYLLAFNATKLHSNTSQPLIAAVQVGQSPIDLTFIKNETRILTADSNRWQNNNTAGISVVNVTAALHGEPAILGRITTGSAITSFPREFAVSHDKHTVLVADYMAEQIESIDVATIP